MSAKLSQLAAYRGKLTECDGSATVEYGMAKNGIFRVRHTPFGRITFKVTEVTGLADGQEGIDYRLPLIPFEIYWEIVAFFQAVYDKYKSEAFCQIYWNPTDERYEIFSPNQKVSAARVEWSPQEAEIPEGWIWVLDAHSHAAMEPFFSATDDGDEAGRDGFFLVIGKFQTSAPSYKFRVGSGKQFRDLPLGVVFDVPKGNQSDSRLERVSPISYAVTSTPSGYVATGAHSGYSYDREYGQGQPKTATAYGNGGWQAPIGQRIEITPPEKSQAPQGQTLEEKLNQEVDELYSKIDRLADQALQDRLIDRFMNHALTMPGTKKDDEPKNGLVVAKR